MAKTVTINILGNATQAIAALDAVGIKAEEVSKKVNETGESGSSSSSKIAEFGKVAGLALVGAAVASVKMAGDFEESMTQLVTGAGESESNLKMVSDGILKMAPQVGETTQQLASGMYLVESAGYHGAAGLSVLKASAEGAKTGNADLATVANAVTTALTDYHLPASQAADVTSALVQTVADGKTHMEDLGLSLGRVMPQAAALGVSFQQVTGAIATMTNAGMSAKLASQHLSNSILALSAPSKVAKGMLAEVGLSAQQVKNTLADPKQGLAGALALIEDHVGHKFPQGSVASVTALKDIMGGTVGYATALMLGGKNMQAFTSNVQNIGSALNKNSQQVQGFNLTQKDLNFQWAQAKATVEVLGIKIGTALIPIIEKLGQDVSKVIGWLEKHQTVAKALGIALGVLAVAFAGVAAAEWLIALNPLSLTIAAVVVVVAALTAGVIWLMTHLHQVADFLHGPWGTALSAAISVMFPMIGIPLLIIGHLQTLKQVALDVWNGIQGAVGAFVGGIEDAINGMVGFFENIPNDIWNNVILPIWNMFVTLPDSILKLFENLGSDIVSAITSHIPGGGLVGKALGAIGGIFEEGGFVPGSGPQLAIVHGGEYVLTQQDVQSLQHPGSGGRFSATGGGGVSGSSATGDLVLTLNGQEYARVAGPVLRTWLLQGAKRNATRVGLT